MTEIEKAYRRGVHQTLVMLCNRHSWTDLEKLERMAALSAIWRRDLSDPHWQYLHRLFDASEEKADA